MTKKSGSRDTTPVKKSSNLPAKVDDFYQTGQTGFEHMGQEDFATPMLRVAQKMTPQADQDSPTAIEGLKPGQFFNPSSGAIFGPKVKVIVLGYFRNFIQWGSGLGEFKKAYTVDDFEKIEKSLIKDEMDYTNDENDRFIDTRNFFIFLPDFPEEGILLFPCYKSAIKASKVLNSRTRTLNLQGVNKLPIFAGVWEIQTSVHTNEGGSWFKLGGPKGDQINFVGYVHKEYKDLMLMIKSSFEIVQENIKNNIDLNYSGLTDPNEVDADEIF